MCFQIKTKLLSVIQLHTCTNIKVCELQNEECKGCEMAETPSRVLFLLTSSSAFYIPLVKDIMKLFPVSLYSSNVTTG